MTIHLAKLSSKLLPTLALLAIGTVATANTLNQNVSWTIDRAGTTTKYRVVAYGDSIYAGYNGSTINAAKYAAPTVDAEYLSALWNADIESVRRAKSGAVASDIYKNKIVAEKSYMQAASTRVITFEMCGNDGLQARSSFKKQTGTCNYRDSHRREQLQDLRRRGDGLHQRQRLFGHQAEDHLRTCTTPATTPTTCRVRARTRHRRHGQPARQVPAQARHDELLDVRVRRAKGLQVRGQLRAVHGRRLRQQRRRADRLRGLRYVAGESEASYLTRITSTLRATLRDANTHFVSASSSYDYIQSDDTHPTYTGGTVTAGLFGGTTGSGAPRYTSFTGGKSPIWNQFGHERMGWAVSTFNPADALTAGQAFHGWAASPWPDADRRRRGTDRVARRPWATSPSRWGSSRAASRYWLTASPRRPAPVAHDAARSNELPARGEQFDSRRSRCARRPRREQPGAAAPLRDSTACERLAARRGAGDVAHARSGRRPDA